jgi:hypothetical protein
LQLEDGVAISAEVLGAIEDPSTWPERDVCAFTNDSKPAGGQHASGFSLCSGESVLDRDW